MNTFLNIVCIFAVESKTRDLTDGVARAIKLALNGQVMKKKCGTKIRV